MPGRAVSVGGCGAASQESAGPEPPGAGLIRADGSGVTPDRSAGAPVMEGSGQAARLVTLISYPLPRSLVLHACRKKPGLDGVVTCGAHVSLRCSPSEADQGWWASGGSAGADVVARALGDVRSVEVGPVRARRELVTQLRVLEQLDERTHRGDPDVLSGWRLFHRWLPRVLWLSRHRGQLSDVRRGHGRLASRTGAPRPRLPDVSSD